MGIFKGRKKAQAKQPVDETTDGVQRFFDGYFQQLQSRGQAYFEESISKTSREFEKSLDETIGRASRELKGYMKDRLDHAVDGNDRAIRQAQAHALQTMSRSVRDISKKHQELSDALQRNLVEQQSVLVRLFQEYANDMKSMKAAQDRAIKSLEAGTQALEQRQQQLSQSLEERIAKEQEVIVSAVEENMAQIIEHYLLGALGDQYDIKAQLPDIIKQMEADKKAITDDMKL